MYCPKCATSNTDDTKFCRGCGANLTLVPQALSGHLPEAPVERWGDGHRGRDRRQRKEQSQLTGGITGASMGIAFLIVSVLLWSSGVRWGLWMLIPAFAMLGRGVASIVSARYSIAAAPPQQTTVQRAPNTGEIQPPPSPQIATPPSVTEQTTRNLDAPIRRSDQVQ